MLMTVLMTDARGMLGATAQQACLGGELSDTLFADDTLIISSRGDHVEEYMAAVEEKGRDYGLQVHWGKVHLICVGAASTVRAPTGNAIPQEASMIYLGSTIHTDGKFACEISRKIGAATAEFKALQPVWKNAHLSKKRKLYLFSCLILSKLRYAVASAWLSKGELRRQDGFHARCLRKMLHIPPSFISRVSNEQVRHIAGQEAFSKMVRAAQLKLLGQILIDPSKRILKEVAFHGDSLVPEAEAFVRNVGRPRDNWTTQLTRIMRRAAGSLQEWLRISSSRRDWNEVAARVIG